MEVDLKERSRCPLTIFFSPFCAGTNKAVDNRPSALAKFLPNSQELGNTSSSEGEKDSPPPEWDSVPVHKPGSCKYGNLGITPGMTTQQGCIVFKGNPVAGSILGQDTCLGCRPGPQLGACDRQQINVSLPLFLPHFPSL